MFGRESENKKIRRRRKKSLPLRISKVISDHTTVQKREREREQETGLKRQNKFPSFFFTPHTEACLIRRYPQKFFHTSDFKYSGDLLYEAKEVRQFVPPAQSPVLDFVLQYGITRSNSQTGLILIMMENRLHVGR